ncbi:MAG: hypothetical protein ABI622_01330 [Chloroflexota bacterium]
MSADRGGDDLVPASVRLGNVVPPEDPEDWTRPLTWMAAVGMLGAPLATLAWFVVAAPLDAQHPTLLTYVVAAILAAGAAATGATQQGVARAATATVGSGLFAALGVVIVGVVMAGERQVGVASPTLAHAFAGAAAGLGGAVAASVIAAAAARLQSRWLRLLPAVAAGGAVAISLVGLVLPPS